MRTWVIVDIIVSLLAAAVVWAEPGDMIFFQGSDGTSGTWMELGNGLGAYQDSRGNTGTSFDLGSGMRSYQFRSPQGDVFGQSLDLGRSGLGTYQDSQGTIGSYYNFHGLGGYQFNSPGGQVESGTFFQFGQPRGRR